MTSEKIKHILTNLGYKLSDFGNHWRTNAIYRGGTNPTAVQVYKDSGVWVDHVKNSSYLPLESLVSATLQTNDRDEISKITGGYDFDAPNSIEPSQPKLIMEKTYPISMLDRLLPHYKFYNNKGISDTVLRDFTSGLCTEGSMYQRFVFPIYNSDSLICGFSGRDMAPINKERPKWKHVGKKSSWIYPFYLPNDYGAFIQSSIYDSGTIILVESIGDLLNLHQHGIKNVLVLFGTSISSAMICFLVSCGCSKIVLSLNNDQEQDSNRGRIGTFKCYLKLLNYFDRSNVIIHHPLANDFGDMQSNQFPKWKHYLDSEEYIFDQAFYKQEIKSFIKSKEIPSSLYKQKFFHE